MAEIKVNSNINMLQNQVLQQVLENLVAPPTSPKEGQIYWDTSLKRARTWNGSTWVHFPYVHPNHSGDVTSSGDGSTTIGSNKVTNVKLSDMAANTIKGNNSTSASDPKDLTVSQVSQMLANSDSTLGGSTPNDAVISSQKAVKTYVDTKVQDITSTMAGALLNKGGYNAATNTPKLDATPIAGIKNGWTYTVTADGDFFTEAVQIGDMIIANKDNPTTLDHWTVVNKNIPDIVDASEAAKGIIEIATQAETNAGTDDARAVTPKKLQQKLGTDSYTRKKVQDIGDGTAKTFSIIHTLGADVLVQIREKATGEVVLSQVFIKSNTEVEVSFNNTPTSNQYTVTIIG